MHLTGYEQDNEIWLPGDLSCYNCMLLMGTSEYECGSLGPVNRKDWKKSDIS